MQTIGNHGLECPDFDDYAAVALYMQKLAETIDQQLFDQFELLTAAINRPTIIATSSATVSEPQGTQFNFIDTVVFNNSSFLSLSVATPIPFFADAPGSKINIGSPAGAGTTIPYDRGSYSTGSCTRMTSTGAVTAYSSRNSAIVIVDESLPVGSSLITEIPDDTSDTNTGGNEAQNAKGTFELSRTSGVAAILTTTHANGVTNVNVLAGALFWVTYNGPINVVEVA